MLQCWCYLPTFAMENHGNRDLGEGSGWLLTYRSLGYTGRNPEPETANHNPNQSKSIPEAYSMVACLLVLSSFRVYGLRIEDFG